jgi:hypothetical protein
MNSLKFELMNKICYFDLERMKNGYFYFSNSFCEKWNKQAALCSCYLFHIPFSFRLWINFKIMDRIKEIKILGKCMCKIFFHNKFHFHLQRMNNQLSIGCGLFFIKDLNITIIPIKYTKPYLAVNNISLFFLTILKAFLITNWGPAKIIFHKFFSSGFRLCWAIIWHLFLIKSFRKKPKLIFPVKTLRKISGINIFNGKQSVAYRLNYEKIYNHNHSQNLKP